MNDIYFYDFNFNLLDIENKFMYVSWVQKYNGVGTFEAHFPTTSKIVSICLENDYIIAVQGENQAIITGKQVNKSFILYGRTPTWLLEKRVTPKFSSMSGTPEELASNIVKTAFSDVDNFEVKRFNGAFETISFWRNVYNATEKVVSECLDRIGAGHKVHIDIQNKKWVYSMIMGGEKPLIISSANRNAYNDTYTEDLQNHVNGGWYESYETSSDGSSVWKYIESDKNGIYKWIGVLGGDSEGEANESLKSREWKKEIKLETKDIKYGVDYNLGDTVKVQTIFGNFKKTISKKIKGVEMTYENGIYTETPLFY